jgi:hypothetical protein
VAPKILGRAACAPERPSSRQATPSWYGDSVGHYEADTLVIDTIGVKTDRPYAMIDLFGTPYYKIIACRRTLLAARIRRRE